MRLFDSQIYFGHVSKKEQLSMILITGATGDIGQELCRLLAQSHVQAKAMCRKPEQLARFTDIGLDAVLADFEDFDSLKQAMHDCERMFLLTAPSPRQAHHLKLAIDAAVAAHVQQVVKISTADANRGSVVPWAKANAEGDHYLRSQNIGWTILRPTGIMQNFLESAQVISRGVLPYVTGDGRVSYIDSRDIALVAKTVLTEDNHANATYYLTGPEALSAKDIAARLSVSLGYEVQATPTSTEAMRNRLQQAGLEEWRIDAIFAQYAVIAGGYATDVTEEVKRLSGQAPRSFAQFAHDYKQYLAQR
jgi:uncharacterized protein YbjT (DUF2867 family)